MKGIQKRNINWANHSTVDLSLQNPNTFLHGCPFEMFWGTISFSLISVTDIFIQLQPAVVWICHHFISFRGRLSLLNSRNNYYCKAAFLFQRNCFGGHHCFQPLQAGEQWRRCWCWSAVPSKGAGAFSFCTPLRIVEWIVPHQKALN